VGKTIVFLKLASKGTNMVTIDKETIKDKVQS